MNGPAVILVALATIFALKLYGKVALSVPCLLGGGVAGFLYGFVFGPWWVMVAGFLAIGTAVYLHEVRNWTRYHNASEALERSYPSNPEFDLFEEWRIATRVHEDDREAWRA